MSAFRVLVVEDDPKWQRDLQKHITLALQDSEPPLVVGTFQDGLRELQKGGWKLLVTDIGLPPGSELILLGMELVRFAKEKNIACIVVSGTKSVTKSDVRRMLRDENYQAWDYFDKDDFDSSPEIQREFHHQIRRILSLRHPNHRAELPPAPAGPSPDESERTKQWLSEVKIAWGATTCVLRRNYEGGKDEIAIREKLKSLFLLFIERVAQGAPTNPVLFAQLDEALKRGRRKTDQGVEEADVDEMSEPDETTSGIATKRLTRAICALNSDLESRLGPTPNGEPWIGTTRGEGHFLNGSIDWVISKNGGDDQTDQGPRGTPPRGKRTREVNVRDMDNYSDRTEDYSSGRRKAKPRPDQDQNDD